MKLNTLERITFPFPSCVVLLSYTLIVNHITGSKPNHALPPTFKACFRKHDHSGQRTYEAIHSK